MGQEAHRQREPLGVAEHDLAARLHHPVFEAAGEDHGRDVPSARDEKRRQRRRPEHPL
jgi:hypothetical protein